MKFSIEEIKRYLLSKESLEEAIKELSCEAMYGFFDNKNSWEYKHKLELEQYEKEIGLLALKQKQLQMWKTSKGKEGKYWMALSPKWIADVSNFDFKTTYKIWYWVNYGDNNTYGWFTVEQIIKWLTTPDLQLSTLGGTKER